jgi:hypothetical protein
MQKVYKREWKKKEKGKKLEPFMNEIYNSTQRIRMADFQKIMLTYEPR